VETWQILILAVVQGIAEFLPISSSGHLVIVAALLGNQSPAELDVADVNIVLHLGTLGSILIFYRQYIMRMLTSDRRVIPLLVVGTIPAAVIGVIVKKKFDYLLESPLLAGAMLLVTGTILLMVKRLDVKTRAYTELSYGETLKIGFAQAFALLPGISRSGMTIVAGLSLGLKRHDAAVFSFLLAIPAIAGASLLQMIDIAGGDGLSTSLSTLAIGATTACIVGIFALWWLTRWLEAGRFEVFGYWCLMVGTGVLIWQLAFQST
jgi:undecaprenyl-diphosphatase